MATVYPLRKVITRLLFAVLIAGIMKTPAIRAADFFVSNTNDSGAGSLRQAVIDANANFGFDTIAIHPTLAGSTISLASPLPALTESIALSGPPAGSTAITSATTIFSGGGAITKQDDGKLTFIGANSYSGGTTIDGGAFQGNTAGIQGDITNNSSVVFDQATPGTYAGDMSGTGNLTKLGAGTLILSGFNSYSGGTIVSAGTLQGDTTSLQGNITNNSSIVFDQAIPGTYTGSISGNGSMTKLAAGTLTLTGNSTYIGGTTVAAGELAVNGSILGPVLLQSGATLSGSGQVGSLTSQGIVAPGGTSIATLTVNGDYDQTGSATLRAQINPAGQGDRINATGSAAVDGALIITGAGNFNAGTTYTLLSTSNGVNGTFSSRQFLFGSGAFEDSQIIYGSTEIQLLLLRNATTLANLAETPNQVALATTLDTLNPLATGGLAVAIDQLNVLDPSAARNAFDQLSGEVYASLTAVEFENSTRYLTLLAERVRTSTFGSMGCCSIDDSGEDDRRETEPPWNGWILGYGMGGAVSSDGNAADVDYTLMGTAVGFDTDLDDYTTLGGAFGYTPFIMDRNHDRITAENYQWGVYGSRIFGPQYVLAAISFGHSDLEASRRIEYGQINQTAEADFGSNQFSMYVETGSHRNWGSYVLQPLVGLQYINVDRGTFQESGADALDLAFSKSNAGSLRSALGGRIARPYFANWGGLVAPEVRARWMHEFMDDTPSAEPRFVEASGAPFTVQGVELGRDFLVLGAGFSAELTPTISAFVNYDAQMSMNEQAHGGNGGLEFIW